MWGRNWICNIFCYVGDNSFLGTFRYWSSLRKSWNGDCFDQDLLQDLLLVEFEKVLVVKKIYIVVKLEKVVVVVVWLG